MLYDVWLKAESVFLVFGDDSYFAHGCHSERMHFFRRQNTDLAHHRTRYTLCGAF